MEIDLKLDADGNLVSIYSEEAAKILKNIGSKLNITRASFVEPDENGYWWADLSPVGGPKLGPYPPECREDALKDEVEWLKKRWLRDEE